MQLGAEVCDDMQYFRGRSVKIIMTSRAGWARVIVVDLSVERVLWRVEG